MMSETNRINTSNVAFDFTENTRLKGQNVNAVNGEKRKRYINEFSTMSNTTFIKKSLN